MPRPRVIATAVVPCHPARVTGPRRALCCSLAVIVSTLAATPAWAYEIGRERLAVTVGTDRVAIDTHGDVLPQGSDRGLRLGARRAARAASADDTASNTAPSLASTWCGTQRSTDDTASDATPPGAAYKVVYAYPADQSSRLEAPGYRYGSLIQGDVRAIADVLATAARGTRTLRLDVGTSCGTQYVDIATVRLPHPRAHYTALGGTERMRAVTSAVRGTLGPLPGVRNLLVYADSLRNGSSTGIGGMYADDRAGATNPANAGGLDAVVWGDGSSSFSTRGNRQTTALHEITHNLGAVQDSAPHTSGASHCTDGFDALCYADGGPKAGGYTTTACAWKGSGIKPYDCGGDDYFNPAPVAGSYLATHWNVFNSVFLCASCSPAGGGTPGQGSSAFATNQPPTARVAVGGAPVTGVPVTLDGTPSGDSDGTVAAYAWDIDGDRVTDSRAATVDVTFAQPGPQDVRLTVMDAAGVSAATTQTISVGPPPEGAASTAQPGPGAAARTVSAALRRAGLRRLARGPLIVKLPALDGARMTVALSARARRLSHAGARDGTRPRVRLALGRSARARVRRLRATRITVLVTATDTAGREGMAKTTVKVRR